MRSIPRTGKRLRITDSKLFGAHEIRHIRICFCRLVHLAFLTVFTGVLKKKTSSGRTRSFFKSMVITVENANSIRKLPFLVLRINRKKLRLHTWKKGGSQVTAGRKMKIRRNRISVPARGSVSTRRELSKIQVINTFINKNRMHFIKTFESLILNLKQTAASDIRAYPCVFIRYFPLFCTTSKTRGNIGYPLILSSVYGT